MSLKSLQKRLDLAKSQDNWDLADMFIKRCDEPISRITTMAEPAARIPDAETIDTTEGPVEDDHGVAFQEPLDFGLGTFLELDVPIDPLDYHWESLWNMVE